jgi:hypothetical protein
VERQSANVEEIKMPGKIYTNEKAKLLDILSKDDLKVLKKDYPFKGERNSKICELAQKGVSYTVLAELPGMLTKSSLHRIGQHGVNWDLSDDEQNLKNKLIKIKAAVDEFYSGINKILKQKGR